MRHRIISLTADDHEHIEHVARFLEPCFRKYSPTWLPDHAARLAQLHASFGQGRRSRVLLDEHDRAIGWIGAIEDDDVWEIHPLAVDPAAQRGGCGRLLVEDVCALARSAGAAAVWAGTSDETQATSFSSVDLYTHAAAAIADFRAPDDHPIHFWLKAGFAIVGVQPDEEGLGKPGIHFARRIV